MQKLVAMGILLAAIGCGDSRTGVRTDGGSTPLPGTLTLAVESAAWIDSGTELPTLLLGVRVGNGAGGDAAPLTPTLFTVDLDSGGQLTASGGGGSNPCRTELAVTAGASVACQLEFSFVNGTPMQVSYRPPMRTASASIDACTPATPSGLCAVSTVCAAGSCQQACDSDHPAGACADPGTLCRAGECVARCSPTHPTGPCEAGVCRSGTCDSSCFGFDTSDTSCTECFPEAAPVVCQLEILSVNPDCAACAYCPFDSPGSDTCTCTSECTPACATESQALWSCLANNCPMCLTADGRE